MSVRAAALLAALALGLAACGKVGPPVRVSAPPAAAPAEPGTDSSQDEEDQAP